MTIYKISLSDEHAENLARFFDRTGGEVDASVAKEIRAQIPKPAIKEPTEFGSIVRASTDKFEDQLWTSAPRTGDHYWHSETGKLEVWSELHDLEVLRVGIGESDEDAEGEAFTAGVRHTIARGTRVLYEFRDQAVTAERKDAYQNAINVLRELS